MPKLYTHTFGCKVNQYETESFREKLEKTGYIPTQDYSDSDICIINTCSVTSEADRKCRQFLRKVLRSNGSSRILVTGCYATRDPQEVRKISPRVEIISNLDKDSIPELVSGCSLFPEDSSLITLFRDHTRAFVKVQDGCDATCTYCIIPSVRGALKSRTYEEIEHEIIVLLEQGYKEIVLTGIRLGSYGLANSGGRVGKKHGNLTWLLEKIVQLPGRFRIRLSSLEITEVSHELMELVTGSDKICRHFHLPLQSGDNSVLKRMGRWYDSDYFQGKVNELRKRIPDAGLTTDVIVGFPGETEENFMNTYRFLETNFNGMHVFPFSSRSGTAAAKLKNTCGQEAIHKRVQRLLELDKRLRKDFQNSFECTQRMVLAESDGGFTDNGIRVPPPLPIQEGQMELLTIPRME